MAERQVVVSGVGETEYVRGTAKSQKQLVMQAAAAACADAGIETSAVDGLVIALSGVPEDYIVSLGIADLRVHASVSLGGASPVAAVALAASLIRAGTASRVLVAAGRNQYSGRARLGDSGGGAMRRLWLSQDIREHLDFPNGFSVPMQWYSLHANRWLYETGAGTGGMRTVALQTRLHAHNNARAYFKDRPLTAEMYDASPMLVRPFRLYDISQESDGAAAVIVERERASGDPPVRPKVYVAGGGEGHPDNPDDLSGRASVLDIGITKVAHRVFADLGARPEDFDFAEIYDCFTFVVLRQLEAMGFCGLGESGDFVAERGIGPGGRFPVNTHGGLLSQAHILGMNHVVEAVRQLRGDAGPAQLRSPRLGLVTGYGDYGDGSLIVLHN